MLRALARKGGNVPALERKPDIGGLEWIWNAFMELDTCRQIGMSVGPIPWTAIQRYAEVHELNAWEREMLDTCLREMDTVRLKMARPDTKKEPQRHGTPKIITGNRR